MNQQLFNDDVIGTDRGVEDELIGKWFPRIGALAVVLGAGFGFKYAIDQGWIGPRLRVMVGLLLASILIAVGDWSRKRDWTAYAQAITGGGVGLLYLTLWASVGMYDLVPPSVGFLCLVGVSGLGCALALRHESQTLALLSVIGGFINPFVTGASTDMPNGLYLYVLTIDLAVVGLSFVRPWGVLEKVAFTASWFVFEVGDAGPTVSMLAATTIFFMFGMLPYVRLLMRRGQGLVDLAFVPANGLIYYFAVFVRLEGELAHLRGWFTLALGIVFLVGLLLVRSSAKQDDIAIGATSGVMSFLFITLWSPLQLGVELMPLGWSVQALLMFGIAMLVKDDMVRRGGWAVLTMATAVQLSFAAIDPVGSLNEDYGRMVFVTIIASLYLAVHLEGQELWDDFRALGAVAGSVITLIWLSLEVYSFVSLQGAVIPRDADLQFGLSGVWALYAGALLMFGLFMRSRPARVMALVLFGVTLVKMAVHDLWLLDTLQRLIGFVGMGVLLLACSLTYHRFRSLLLPTREGARL